MTNFDPGFWVAVVAVGGAALAWRLASARRHIHRMNSLAVAKQYAEIHKDELKCFLETASSGDELKEILISVSDLFFEKSLMTSFAKWVVEQRQLQPPRLGSFDLASALEELRKADPQNAARFQRAFGSGMVAAFHRWPETNTLFDAFATKTMADPDQEARIVASAATQRPGSGSDPLNDVRHTVSA